jgi:hypothetical protein
MARPIRNNITKLTELFFLMYLLPEFSRYYNDVCLKLTGQNEDSSPDFWKKFLDLASESSKNIILAIF